MTEGRELAADEIRALLIELGKRLADKKMTMTIYLVGGAAIALTMDHRRVTDDIDAIFADSDDIDAIVSDMAREHGLADDWLNSKAKMFLPHEPDPGDIYLDTPGLVVTTASAEHLLAMKLAAFRPQDIEDLELLFRHLGISTAREAVDRSFATYGGADESYAETVGGGSRDDFMLRAQAVINRLG